MNVKLPIALVILLAAAAGYLLGTEAGRSQRDMILVKLGKGEAGGDDATAAASEDATA